MQTPTVRGLRLSGILSHEDYFSFLIEVIGRKRLIPLLPRGYEKSTDEHLNDIPLARWDAAHMGVRRMAGDTAWITAWSLSDSCCVLKTLAKQEMGRI